jgi:23S rRNA (pseudouridine1915-N3)-methyltransferase
MRLIAIGRLRPSPERDLFDDYRRRLRPALELTELPEARGTPAEIKRREGDSILAALTPATQTVALDLGAPAPSSEALAKQLEIWLAGRPLAFVIGGAEGLAPSVLARADHLLSLGPLTWPHMLVRVMLAEQLYRARCIATGHPYHRGGRPTRPKEACS